MKSLRCPSSCIASRGIQNLTCEIEFSGSLHLVGGSAFPPDFQCPLFASSRVRCENRRGRRCVAAQGAVPLPPTGWPATPLRAAGAGVCRHMQRAGERGPSPTSRRPAIHPSTPEEGEVSERARYAVAHHQPGSLSQCKTYG